MPVTLRYIRGDKEVDSSLEIVGTNFFIQVSEDGRLYELCESLYESNRFTGVRWLGIAKSLDDAMDNFTREIKIREKVCD